MYYTSMKQSVSGDVKGGAAARLEYRERHRGSIDDLVRAEDLGSQARPRAACYPCSGGKSVHG